MISNDMRGLASFSKKLFEKLPRATFQARKKTYVEGRCPMLFFGDLMLVAIAILYCSWKLDSYASLGGCRSLEALNDCVFHFSSASPLALPAFAFQERRARRWLRHAPPALYLLATSGRSTLRPNYSKRPSAVLL